MRALRARNLHSVSRSGNLSESVSVEAHLPQLGNHRGSIPGGDRLDSWKDIASYLTRTIRTVQRWEKREGLPVYRHVHLKAGTVYAFKNEIDVWVTGRGQAQSEAHRMQKHSNYPANGLNPPLYLTGQMFAAFRRWLAMVERESYQSFDETVIPDLTLTPHDCCFFIQGPKSERKFGHDNSRPIEDVVHCRLCPRRMLRSFSGEVQVKFPNRRRA